MSYVWNQSDETDRVGDCQYKCRVSEELGVRINTTVLILLLDSGLETAQITLIGELLCPIKELMTDDLYCDNGRTLLFPRECLINFEGKDLIDEFETHLADVTPDVNGEVYATKPWLSK